MWHVQFIFAYLGVWRKVAWGGDRHAPDAHVGVTELDLVHCVYNDGQDVAIDW